MAVLAYLFVIPSVQSYFISGGTHLSIIHARISTKCSDLNFYRCNNHLIEDAHCECGYVAEDAEHFFFFQCPKYVNARVRLFDATRTFHTLNCQILLYGEANATVDENIDLDRDVESYIKETCRFVHGSE